MTDDCKEIGNEREKIKGLIRRALDSRGRKARFVTELAAGLRRAALGDDKLEPVLAELEADGMVMVRDHFCADPHLTGVDLRVAALVQNGGGAEAQLSAIRAIDEAWDKWLAEYLANHRCG